MGLFNNIFGDNQTNNKSTSGLPWKQLTDIQQLTEIAEESATTPAIIFKHSTRCSISRMALKTFEREYAIDAENATPYFLDLLEHRDISNEIASKFGVQHQSPQLLLIKDGKAIYHSSHSDIDAGALKSKIA
ncbi:MAG: bacillithiol system redox-active protein YtxJ [Flavobacterium sp.]|nr:MAG: bacillithiol system redox-active protein YtxJ [Flavobacterium sp.]